MTEAGKADGAGPLLERDRELALLDGAILDAVGGRPAVCVVEGPAGIGKTRLLAEARSRAAERGVTVLWASARELEQGFGFGVVGQLFEPAVRADAARLLSGAAAPAGAIVGPDRSPAQDVPSEGPSFASLHGLYWLTARLCEHQPVLLAIDDLQWCDVPSLRFLAYLRARLDGLAAAVVCSLRYSDPAPDAAVVLDAVVGDPTTVRVRPRPLSEAATSALIEHRLETEPEHAFVSACHGATGGNPLLLEELGKVLKAEGARPDRAHLAMLKDLGPAAVPRTVLLRLGRLGTDATLAAQALAILGDGADLGAVANLAGLDIQRAGRATAALAQAEIVRAEPPLRFVHPLVAAAVYRDVLPGERELLHVRAAELLAASHAPVEKVAAHLLHAPARGESWVVDQLSEAAAEASRKGAADSAASYLERALAEPPTADGRPGLLIELGRTMRLRDGAAAAEHLRAAYALVVDSDARAGIADILARTLLLTGAGDEAVRVLREAADALPPELGDRRKQLEAVELFCAWMGVGGRDAFRRLHAYRTEPVADGLGAKMLAAIAAHEWMYACGPSDAVAELSLAALAGGELVSADRAWAATFLITNLTFADREEAEDWWELASAEAHRRGSMTDMAAVTSGRGTALHRRGELADAEQSARAFDAALHQWGFAESVTQAYCNALLATVLRDRGDLPAARRAAGAGPDLSSGGEGTRRLLGSHLELLLAEGKFDDVLATADEYAGRFDHIVRNPMDVPWRSVKALALDRLGRREEAFELASAELDLARAWGAPGTVSRSLRALGIVEREDGLEHLEEAVEVTARTPARLEHAKALTALGMTLRRARRPADARTHLRQGLELATISGAELLAQQARSELYAAGGRPRRTALTGVGALTASERRVAELAADGHTNRQIGETLFITPKTVAMHLSNAYPKLGVTSRRELPAALADTSPAHV